MHRNIEGIVLNSIKEFYYIKKNYLKNLKIYDYTPCLTDLEYPKIIIKRENTTLLGTKFHDYCIYLYEDDNFKVEKLKENNKLLFTKDIIRKEKLKRINNV